MQNPNPLEHACELTQKGFRWARSGHPWIYRDDVASISGEHGDIVRVTYEKRCLGSAFLGTRSKIALRWIERSAEPRAPDADFWRERIAAAAARRAAIAARAGAYRAVHDSADGLPGLVIDRYGPVASVQTTIAGTERLLPLIAEAAREILGAEAVIARNDLAVREKEGLPQEVRVLHGEPPPRVWIAEEGPRGRVEYPAAPLEGQKTGAFLDQRENRWRAAELARGRFLDAFGYSGLFALHAARGVEEAVVVDSSAAGLELCEQAAERNGLANVRTVQMNVFDFLKEAHGGGESFGTAVLDPPAFARSRKDLPAALRGYREINRRAMSILAPGGLLVTCSCSYNLSAAEFIEVLRDAAADARRDFRVIEQRTQSADHPILLCHPESQYLKCVILERV